MDVTSGSSSLSGRRRWVAAGVTTVVVIGIGALTAFRWMGDDPQAASKTTTASLPIPPGLRAPAQAIPDLAYADRSPAQRLDLVLPDRHGPAIPLVIVIHGGGFLGGDKTDDRGLLEAANSAGYAAASINYRLSGEAPFPAGVQDAKAAVRWLRANAATWGVDPNRFAVWGLSAGGHLAAMIGTTGSLNTDLDDPGLGAPGVSSAVQAVVDWYGPSDFLTMDAQGIDPGGCPEGPPLHDRSDSPESRWLGAPIQEVPEIARDASPISYLGQAVSVPPFFLAHGLSDCTVPYGQSRQLADALTKAGGQVTIALVPNAGHAVPEIAETQTAPALAFLQKTFGH